MLVPVPPVQFFFSEQATQAYQQQSLVHLKRKEQNLLPRGQYCLHKVFHYLRHMAGKPAAAVGD